MSDLMVYNKNRLLRIRGTVLFRWLLLFFILPISFLSYRHTGQLSGNTFRNFMILYFLFIAYSIALHYSPSCKTKIAMPSFLLYIDVIFISMFISFLGGLSSDLYLIYFFIIGYDGLKNGKPAAFKNLMLVLALYTYVCITSTKIDYFTYYNLLLRYFYLIAITYSTDMIVNEVKRYDDLRKKEFKLARIDKLTGLANRHHLEQWLSEEVTYSKNNNKPLSILIFDLDNFKLFNDTYGHLWGDKLLTLFADIIKENIRGTDLAVRFGGEEFLVLLRDINIEKATPIADRIRHQLEKKKIIVAAKEDNKHIVTVSCGISQYPLHSENIKDAIDLADKALYKAKHNGKNQVMQYTPVNTNNDNLAI